MSQYLSAHIARAHGDTRSAADFLNKIQKRNSQSYEILNELMPLEVDLGRMRSAVRHAREIIQINPDHSFAQLVLAIHLLKRKRYAEAFRRLTLQGRPPASWPGAPLLAAWNAYAFGKKEQALLQLSNSTLAPALFSFHKALIQDLSEENAAAMSAFVKAIGESPYPDARISLLYANFLERQGEEDKARRIYERFASYDILESPVAHKALERLRKNAARDRKKRPAASIDTPLKGMAEALYNFALFSMSQNAFREAVFYLRLALYLHPSFDSAWMRLAAVFEGREHYEAAIDLYRKIRASSPFALQAGIRIAINRKENGESLRAKQLLKRLVKQYPQSDEAFIALGDIHIADRQFDEAVLAYSHALQRAASENASESASPNASHSTSWRVIFARGTALERSGKWDEAERDLKKAVRLSNNNPLAVNYLAYSWVDRNIHLQKALPMLQEAVRKSPENGMIIDSLGWAYYRMGDYQSAVRYLLRAAELEPQETEINDHLGDVLWKMGSHIEARFQWSHALESALEDKDATEKTRARIKKKIRHGLQEAESQAHLAGADS